MQQRIGRLLEWSVVDRCTKVQMGFIASPLNAAPQTISATHTNNLIPIILLAA